MRAWNWPAALARAASDGLRLPPRAQGSPTDAVRWQIHWQGGAVGVSLLKKTRGSRSGRGHGRGEGRSWLSGTRDGACAGVPGRETLVYRLGRVAVVDPKRNLSLMARRLGIRSCKVD